MSEREQLMIPMHVSKLNFLHPFLCTIDVHECMEREHTKSHQERSDMQSQKLEDQNVLVFSFR